MKRNSKNGESGRKGIAWLTFPQSVPEYWRIAGLLMIIINKKSLELVLQLCLKRAFPSLECHSSQRLFINTFTRIKHWNLISINYILKSYSLFYDFIIWFYIWLRTTINSSFRRSRRRLKARSEWCLTQLWNTFSEMTSTEIIVLLIESKRFSYICWNESDLQSVFESVFGLKATLNWSSLLRAANDCFDPTIDIFTDKHKMDVKVSQIVSAFSRPLICC